MSKRSHSLLLPPAWLWTGLSGVMVGLLRLGEQKLNPNLAAGTLTDQEPLLTQVFDHSIQRAQNATDSQSVANQMKQALDIRRDEAATFTTRPITTWAIKPRARAWWVCSSSLKSATGHGLLASTPCAMSRTAFRCCWTLMTLICACESPHERPR